MTTSSTRPADPATAATRLPLTTLIALMLCPFAFSTGAFVFGGLLVPMSESLGTTVTATAQLQTVFTLACALGGPALAVLLKSQDRRKVLIAVMLATAIANVLSAVAAGFGMLVIVRVLAGLVGALTVPFASAIGATLVPPEQRGTALAIVSAGTALSFLIGIPLGSVIGGAFGWQMGFWFAAALAAAVALLVVLLVPAADGAAPPAAPQGVFSWPLVSLYLCTCLAFVATFATVGLIGPLITALTGLTGTAVGPMQIFIGIGAMGGLAIGARLANTVGAAGLKPLFAVIAVSQAMYLIALAAGITGTTGAIVFALSTMPGAAALFATFPVVAAAIAERAGASAPLAFALNGAMIFLGQGLGVAIGGVGFSIAGLIGASVLGTVIALVGNGFVRLRGIDKPAA